MLGKRYRKNRFDHTIKSLSPYLVVSLFSLQLPACSGENLKGNPNPSSHINIRGGSAVPEDSTRPERLATVGLVAQTAQGRYTCSAVLLQKNILATAAHCVDSLESPAQIKAFFGTNFKQEQASGSSRTFEQVTAFVAHPQYELDPEPGTLPRHDLALLKLKNDAPARFQPLPIPEAKENFADVDEVVLAGFGITETGRGSGILRATQARLAGFDDVGRLQISDPNLRGACSGDSGGPLIVTLKGVNYAAGVLSGGPVPCRGINVYTALSAERAFIQATLAEFQARLDSQ